MNYVPHSEPRLTEDRVVERLEWADNETYAGALLQRINDLGEFREYWNWMFWYDRLKLEPRCPLYPGSAITKWRIARYEQWLAQDDVWFDE